MPGEGERLAGVDARDVRERLAGETDGRAIERLIAIWERLEGQTAADIEARYRLPAGTVEAWQEVVADGGLDALVTADPGSRPVPVGDRKRLAHTEEKLRALQETTRELMAATTVDGIIDVALHACVDVLGLPISVYWLYDEERDVLVAYKQTEYGHVVMGTLPSRPFERGDGIVWRAVESGEVHYWEDLRELGDELFDPDTDLRSEIDVPLGRYGVLGMGSMSPAEFDDVDVDMCRILGRAVESALARAERERALEQQTERLEAMAEAVSHDLRTPLDVGATRLRLLEEELENAVLQPGVRDAVGEHVDAVQASMDRAIDIAGELLALTEAEGPSPEQEPTDLRTVATEVWETVETGGLDLSVRGSRTVVADEGQLRRLLENCVRNAIEHADADVVRVGATAGGFYIEDDGRGVPAGERERVFERGYSTVREGSGLGLAIVEEIADEYGWQVGVAEGTDGGARIEVHIEPDP